MRQAKLLVLAAFLVAQPGVASPAPSAVSEDEAKALFAELLAMGGQGIPASGNHCDNPDVPAQRRLKVRDVLRDALAWTLVPDVPKKQSLTCKGDAAHRSCELAFAIGPFPATKDGPGYEGASVLLTFRVKGKKIEKTSLACLATP